MISLLMLMISVITNVIISAAVHLVKAVFSLFKWIFRTIAKVLKLFFVVLPITSIVTALLALVTMGTVLFDSQSTGTVLFQSTGTVLFDFLGAKGMTTGTVLFIAVVADAALYLVRAVFGKGFVSQALSRYYRLFPEAGIRHEERRYNRLMKERNDELEAEMRSRKQKRREKFYEDEDYADEGYDPEFENEYGADDDFYEDGYAEGDDGYYEDDEYYEDDYPEDDEYYKDDYPEDDDYYEDADNDYCEEDADDYYEEGYEDDTSDYDIGFEDGRRAAGNFDFFAGCNSRESVDRKYKSLVKLYHPDNMDGDTAALQEINAQYAAAKKKWN